jgi:3-oxoacyl-[acyl-carrier protein] reductase
MDLQISGKHALVTGGSRGLGKQSALALGNEGVNISICARGENDLANTTKKLEKLGISVSGFLADLSKKGSAKKIFSEVTKNSGPIDILVNNVGGSLGTSDIVGSTMDDFERVMNVNLWSAVELMKLVIPDMKKNKWGRIVNISSIYGREFGGTAPYMTAKAAMIAASKHASQTLATTGITVNSVSPGSIWFEGGSWDNFVNSNTQKTVTSFIEKNLPMGKFGWPEPIGATVAFLSSQNADLITGACINVDGGQSHNLF